MDKAVKVYKLLYKVYPNARITLIYRNDFELFILAILSANATDSVVNRIGRKLFEKYPNAKALSRAELKEIEKIIKPIGMYKQKARYIKESAKMLAKIGRIPNTLQELQKFPGVGRKVANVILTGVYKKAEGIAVDTHVKRVSYRLGLTASTNPMKIERDLMEQLPKKYWSKFSLLLIAHGRKICKAKKSLCNKCVLDKICLKRGVKI